MRQALSTFARAASTLRVAVRPGVGRFGSRGAGIPVLERLGESGWRSLLQAVAGCSS